MSTSLLYHAFGVRGYDYVKTDYAQGTVTFTVAQDPKDWRCAACGCRLWTRGPGYCPPAP